MIRVIRCVPGEQPVSTKIEPTLESFQKEVGGYIEHVELPGGITLVCNEDGRLKSLPPNREVPVRPHHDELIVGPFVLCRHDDDGKTTSLTDHDVMMWMPLLWLNNPTRGSTQ